MIAAATVTPHARLRRLRRRLALLPEPPERELRAIDAVIRATPAELLDWGLLPWGLIARELRACCD